MFNALLRTHHITSRRKVAKLRQAAKKCNVFALLRTGGAPGIMYVQGEEQGVAAWVETVQNLRYKDFSVASRIARMVVEPNTPQGPPHHNELGQLVEVERVKDFAKAMQDIRVFSWWRLGMGYKQSPSDDG